MWSRFLVSLSIGLGLFSTITAQVSIRDSSISLVMVTPFYSGYQPGSDMEKRYGYTSIIGIECGYKHRSNFYTSISVGYLFGENIKEKTIFKDIVASSGLFINQYGNLTSVGAQERGIVIPLRIGKIWPLRFPGNNPNSGIYTETGIQFLEHYIHIITDRSIPMLSGSYLKGYDRLTSGVGLLGSIGYRFFGNRRAINFFAGLEFSYNYTKSRRPYDFDLRQKSSQNRTDILYGFRAGWTLPLYRQAPEKQYFF